MNFCLTVPAKVNTSSEFLPLTVCFTLSKTFLDIQLVPEPESSKVLTLKYRPLLASNGMIIVGEIDDSASLDVLIKWWTWEGGFVEAIGSGIPGGINGLTDCHAAGPPLWLSFCIDGQRKV